MSLSKPHATILAITLCATTITASVDAVHAAPPNYPVPRCAATAVCIAIGDATIIEGNAGNRTLTFPVTLNRPATSLITVQYSIQGITATGGASASAGVDVKNKNGALTTIKFTPGTLGTTPVYKTAIITAYPDTSVENDETFAVTLSNPVGATLQRTVATGMIIDDDANTNLTVGVGDSALYEGDSGKNRKLTIPVSFSSAPGMTATVGYVVSPVGATPGVDYSGVASGTLTFTPTTVVKKLLFTGLAGTAVENDETFTVTITLLTTPFGTTISRASGTATIIDDDPPPTTDPIPNSMAAIGDSITRAFDSCPPMFGECLTASYATGTTVGSHYERILAVNPAIAGNAYNDAVTGATSANLASQTAAAVGQNVDYVMILMGANDACTSTQGSMTSTSTYQSRITATLNTLTTNLPNARISIASVPDIYRLWEVGNPSTFARNAWSNFSICQSMLANPLSTAQVDVDRRIAVRQRVIDYNTILANTCAAYTHCKFDGNLVFNYQFILSDLSPIDFFHPNYGAQATLALGTYAAGYNW